MDYERLRHAADSWGLLFLTLVFLAVVFFAFRRGSSARYRDAAGIPLRNDKRDADNEEARDD